MSLVIDNLSVLVILSTVIYLERLIKMNRMFGYTLAIKIKTTSARLWNLYFLRQLTMNFLQENNMLS